MDVLPTSWTSSTGDRRYAFIKSIKLFVHNLSLATQSWRTMTLNMTKSSSSASVRYEYLLQFRALPSQNCSHHRTFDDREPLFKLVNDFNRLLSSNMCIFAKALYMSNNVRIYLGLSNTYWQLPWRQFSREALVLSWRIFVSAACRISQRLLFETEYCQCHRI